ncbi:MAG: PAS domain S-box protein [Nitrospira sp.]
MTYETVVFGIVLALGIGLATVVGYRRGLDVRRQAEADLHASRLKHRLIVEALPIVTYSASASGDFGALWVSENIEVVSGFPGSAFLNDSGLWAERIHPDDKARALLEFERLHQTGTLNSEYRWQTSDGTYHWFQDRAVLYRDRETDSATIMGLWFDITERKEIEERLRVANERLTAVIHSSPVGIVILDGDGICGLWNAASESIFGWGASEVLGRPLPTVPPFSADEHRALRERVMKDEAFTDLEVVRQRKDGSPVRISLSTAPLRNSSGVITGLLGLMVDITQRKQAQEELRRSRDGLRALAKRLHTIREEERMRIAREVHDELGQSLTSMKMDLSWVMKRLINLPAVDSQPLMRERLEQAMQQIDHTIKSVREIATALRPSVLDELGLAAAIDWQTGDFEKRTGIRCDWSMPSAPIPVGPEEATAVFRIFQEMLTNVARHAQATAIRVRLTIAKGGLTLEVRDNGCGISESALAGMDSLGLLGMRERAAQCGGSVTIRRDEEGGTVAKVRIPLLIGGA